MTHRERLERKRAKREEWAEKRNEKAEQGFAVGRKQLECHAFKTQPGRIPERERIHAAHGRALRDAEMADHHEEKAQGLAAQLDHSIYDDDPDAVERLEERVAQREADHKAGLALNRKWRKAGKPHPDAEAWAAFEALVTEEEAARAAKSLRIWSRDGRLLSWAKPYEGKNANASIRRDKKRLEQVRAQQARHEKAEKAGGVLIEQRGAEYACVTFDEKPPRATLNALKAAGYRWAKGSWVGRLDALPDDLAAHA